MGGFQVANKVLDYNIVLVKKIIFSAIFRITSGIHQKMQPLTESNILSCLPHWNNSIFHFHVSMWWKIIIVPKLALYPRAGFLILSVVWNNEYWTHYFLMLGWKWKTRLTIERITVETGHRLTNIRYGDDLMLYTTSGWTELHAVGLECNARKTEMLTTSNFVYRNTVGDTMIEILHGPTTQPKHPRGFEETQRNWPAPPPTTAWVKSRKVAS